jgi:enamine deaminase RidA (YjgF/YER057c/UK114 family)
MKDNTTLQTMLIVPRWIRFGFILLLGNGCDKSTESHCVTYQNISARGYSESVEYVQGLTKMLFISGQVATNANGDIVGQGDLQKQTELIFEKIKRIVEGAGGKMDNVVRINCYFKDISEIQKFRVARDKYINLQEPPASTAIQVSRFVNEEFLIEIDAIAIVPQ